MDLNQLRTFVTVAEIKNLTKAAEKLFLTQPAISNHIKLLENEFNIKLFQRHHRTMELTIAGSRLYEEAISALNAAKNFVQKAKLVNNQYSCHLGTISAPTILGLPQILSQLQAQFNSINLVIHQNISGHIIDKVLNKELDAGFIIGEDIENEKLQIIKLAPINLCFIAPYKWKDKFNHFKWQDISNYCWISTPKECSFSKISERFFDKKNIKLQSTIIADQEKTLTELVSMELGLSLVREDIALSAQELKQIVIINNERITSHLCFIWNKDKYPSPVIPELLKIVKDIWHINE